MNKTILSLAAGVFAMGLAGSSLAGVLIDNFDNANAMYNCPFSGTDQSGAGIVGGTRTLSCSAPSILAGNPNLASTPVEFGTLSGNLEYAADPNEAADVQVLWNAAGVAGGLGGVDLTDGGTATQFDFEVAFLDGIGLPNGVPNFFFQLVVESINGTTITWNFDGNSGPSPLINSSFLIPFVAGTGDMAALQSADSILLAIQSNNLGIDFRIDSLSTTGVPVASPLLLLSLGIGLLGFVRLRH